MDALTENIPGTVRLIDVQEVINLVPQPSVRPSLVPGRFACPIASPSPQLTPSKHDPDDPLKWTKKRKTLAMACILAYTIAVGISSAAIYSVFENISAHTGLNLSTLNQGTGYMFLSFGWGCLFWQPLALQYGKRPVYLLSTIGTMAAMIWAPYTYSQPTWIASKVLQGFFGAPIESLCAISVTDLYFVHERGFYTTLYALVLSGSSTGAPIVGGFIADGQGWQWVLYWCAILCAVVFVLLALLMEETNYSRSRMDPVREINSPLGSPMGDGKSEGPDSPWTPVSASDSTAAFGHAGSLPRTKKTWFDKCRLWQEADLPKPNQLGSMVKRPFVYTTFPVIAFCGFSYGASLTWYNLLNATSSLVLTKIYKFRTRTVGVSYLAVLLGVLIAAVYTGLYGNRLMIKLARKNGGVLESEHRLWLLLPQIFILPAGFVLWGVGASYRIHWFAMILAMFLITGGSAIAVQESINYCISSYSGHEAVVAVILIRNTMFFAVSYGLTPWVTHLGLRNAFISAAVVAMCQGSSFLPIIRYGKRLRRRTAPRLLNMSERD
ncbi:uncharacterized protein PV07_12635 [Cladophialophora immunda]|uniref:Major facilitator superfamily (MFS) profile domain-containing protein n=1 Tax=Cladophialophora immunda TaxID=569365 RepID=A0A0D2CEJ4_9EURO|nr:uncharacterized protein PV07_12635 [Cladophialophora immunda]KIW21959.1 hypothetical protein PV07_12635 [Cladophialophora immunda]